MATVQGVYLALFGRPADAGGLAYWNGVTKNGADLSLMLKELPALPEYTGRFTGMTNEQIVNSIYQALFGRDAEPAGLAGFVAALANGTQTISSIAVNILDGAQGSDKARIDAKLAASDIFTAHLDLPNEQAAYNANTIQIAKDYLSAVTENSPGTAALADAAIAKMLQQGGGAPVGDDPGPNGAPVITSAGDFTVDENHVGLVFKATATDDNPEPVAYSLIGPDAGLFTIDPVTGEVTFNSPPNYEVQNQFQIGVVAQDSTGFAAIKGVTINVNNLDDENPEITSATTAAVNENIGANQVVYTATATDDKSATITFSITGGADQAKFTINSATGAVKLTDDPNFELKSSYTFQVTATDETGDTDVQTVTLSINDTVENTSEEGNGAGNTIDKTGSLNNWTIDGKGGGDTIKGGLGNDVITGGAGSDALTGGGGADVFKFAGGDSTAGTVDVITDFVQGTDKIDLNLVDARQTFFGAFTGDQAFEFIGANGDPGYGQLSYFHENGNTIIVGDTSANILGNDGTQEVRIQLTGVHNLTAADFIL